MGGSVLEGEALLFQKDLPMKAFGTAISGHVMAPLSYFLIFISPGKGGIFRIQSIAGASALCVLGGEESVPPDLSVQCLPHPVFEQHPLVNHTKPARFLPALLLPRWVVS